MAEVIAAIDYVLGFEDSTLSGRVTVDGGGRTRFGIAEKFHPWIAVIGFYTTMPKDEALGAARLLYLVEYCLPLQIAALPDQDIANKLISLSATDGLTYPTKWLQEAVGAMPDGRIGPATLAVLGKADKKKALDSLKEQAVAYYQDVARQHPEDAQYLRGWIARANA